MPKKIGLGQGKMENPLQKVIMVKVGVMDHLEERKDKWNYVSMIG